LKIVGLQQWIHRMELGGGARVVKAITALLAFFALALTYDLREYRNFSTTEAMDTAQLARNLAALSRGPNERTEPMSLHEVNGVHAEVPQKPGFAKEQLKSLIERIERVEEEKAALAGDIREIYAEAKGHGFDTKIMREVVRLRKVEAHEREERDTLLDLYLSAVGMAR